jgi:hypothetical protein
MGRSMTSFHCYDGSEPNGDVIFSFVEGFVWASWPGAVSMVRLGRYETVLAAMHDFAAQSELGERLVNGAFKSAPHRSL